MDYDLSRIKADESLCLIFTGTPSPELLQEIGEKYSIHNLVLEDILNIHQRPKIETYQEHIFVVMKALEFDSLSREVSSAQTSFYLTKDVLLVFCESPVEGFSFVRKRLHVGKGRIRVAGLSYLLFAFLDTIVDRYLVVLDDVSNLVESLESQLYQKSNADLLRKIRISDSDDHHGSRGDRSLNIF